MYCSVKSKGLRINHQPREPQLKMKYLPSILLLHDLDIYGTSIIQNKVYFNTCI